MKTKFTKSELLASKGCYSKEKINELFPTEDPVTIDLILSQDVSIKDLIWFVYNSCELTVEEKKELDLKMVWCVLPIYENEYPEDYRVRNCLKGIEDYKTGIISVDELSVLIRASYAASAASYAAYAAASAADAYADDTSYSDKLILILKEFAK